MVNPNSDEQAAKVRPPDLKLNDNGPDVSAKFERKRWLEKFLTKSSSRYPLPRPGWHLPPQPLTHPGYTQARAPYLRPRARETLTPCLYRPGIVLHIGGG